MAENWNYVSRLSDTRCAALFRSVLMAAESKNKVQLTGYLDEATHNFCPAGGKASKASILFG